MNDTGILIAEWDGDRYLPLCECLRSEIAEMIANYLPDGPVIGFFPPDRFMFWTRGKGGEYECEEVGG